MITPTQFAALEECSMDNMNLLRIRHRDDVIFHDNEGEPGESLLFRVSFQDDPLRNPIHVNLTMDTHGFPRLTPTNVPGEYTVFISRQDLDEMSFAYTIMNWARTSSGTPNPSYEEAAIELLEYIMYDALGEDEADDANTVIRGDHDGFARMVMNIPGMGGPVDWVSRKASDGYAEVLQSTVEYSFGQIPADVRQAVFTAFENRRNNG